MAKYCAHCGKKLNDNAIFCKYCGSKVEAEETAKEEKGLSKNMTLIIVIAAVVVVVAAVGAILFLGKAKEDTSADRESAATVSEETQKQEESGETQAQSVESKGSGTASVSGNDSQYIVGETYTVQTNLRVREGPDKNAYRVLYRSELTPEDYAKSVDSTTTEDALLEKGCQVTCLEMSGNWMRISSGWICVEDEGEVLVK